MNRSSSQAVLERQMLRMSAHVNADTGIPRECPLRVAFLTPMPSPYIQDLFAAMHRDARIEMHVFYMEMAAPDTYWGDAQLPCYASLLRGQGLQAFGVRTHINPGAARIIAGWDPDLVVVGGYTSLTCQYVMRWLRRRRLPWLFWAERPGVTERGGLFRFLRTLAMQPAIRWPSGIAAIGEMARQVYSAKARKGCIVHSIPYCCNIAPFLAINRSEGHLRDASNRSILYCGQLIERKGVDLLIDAFSRVASADNNVSLTLVGTGPMNGHLVAAVHASLRDRVTFAGFQPVSRLPAYFSAADIFILPSRHDGWGVVINQAIAAGLPVIASDAVGAAVELVRPNVNGLIVPAGDINRLTDAIRHLVESPKLIAQMSQASRLLAHDITPEAIVDRWMRLIEESCDIQQN